MSYQMAKYSSNYTLKSLNNYLKLPKRSRVLQGAASVIFNYETRVAFKLYVTSSFTIRARDYTSLVAASYTLPLSLKDNAFVGEFRLYYLLSEQTIFQIT